MIADLLIAKVALDVPQIGQNDGFDYLIRDAAHPAQPAFAPPLPGSWVQVPWGKSQRVGLVVALAATSALEQQRLRAITHVLIDAPTPDPAWIKLLRFVADYYHRSLGEVALPAIPKLLRQVAPANSKKPRPSIFARSRQRYEARDRGGDRELTQHRAQALLPTQAQTRVLSQLPAAARFGVHLLHGVTGSGKTELYLQWIALRLGLRNDHQALLLVPEINLTPQLLERVQASFPALRIAVLHSDVPDAQRAADWLAAAEGRAQIVIGTRLGVMAPLPKLTAIVIDEEQDPSYKQQEGVRYSARDVAIARAKMLDIPVLLASATPSFESWHAATRKRYRLLQINERATGASLPLVRIIATRDKKLRHALSDAAIDAINAVLARNGQVLVFINRRGYSPVLSCAACNWTSACENCSAHRVLHRVSDVGIAVARHRYRLICHHCGADSAVPRACPTCGNVDLQPLGRGSQRLEEGLAQLFPAARIARLDRDVARHRGAARKVLAATHAGDVDILVGTQMLAKGHDFDGLSLVVVVDPDSALFAADFRAPERLFATLMQVAGRAGRASHQAARSEVIVQTRYPDHPLFESLRRHDYEGFANSQLREREQAGLPPFVHQALLRAEAKKVSVALDWLRAAKALAAEHSNDTDRAANGAVTLFDPVPLALVRVADVERAQLLLESRSRTALHQFLKRWLPLLRATKPAVPSLRWQLEVDPLEI